MPVLILAASPIGNPLDASERLKSALATVEFVAAEDSRRFGRLCQDLGITHNAKVISFFEGNESERLEMLMEILQSGKDLLVITDAGLPGVSDPGFRLAREAVARNIPLSVLPGPSAVTTALLLSGIPTDRFAFDGFPPRTSGARLRWYEKLATEERTMIFFEAPHRLVESLHDLRTALGGDRQASISREMTKRYEETVRGSLDELIEWSESKEVLGEITVVVAGYDPGETIHTEADFVEMVLARESAGEMRKEAIAAVAKELGVQKRLVFDAMVHQKSNDKI
ncbi:MAG: rRNA (cytidine1402-2-O)-methyltransferase [Actinomycetota bacterium]|jgi:16S rRNA (cytidine1402-2'-O)-methyltransferase